MKRFIIAAATALPLMATSAYAFMDAPEPLVESVDRTLTTFGYDIDVEQLTDQQITNVYLAAQSGMPGEKRRGIENALGNVEMSSMTGEDQSMPVGNTNSLRIAVQHYLDNNGFDASVSTLSDAQVSSIYLTAFGGDSSGSKKSKIEATLGS